MLKKIVLVLAMIACLSATTATAAEGRISDRSLARMGLQGMQTMSDERGLAVRGAGMEDFLKIDIDIKIVIKIFININIGHHHHHHR